MSIGVRLCDLGRSYVANVRLNVFQHKRSKKNMILAIVIVKSIEFVSRILGNVHAIFLAERMSHKFVTQILCERCVFLFPL